MYSDRARDSIREAFFYELKQGLISDIALIDNCSIIAAVGESMSNMPGVSGLFFTALGGASINVLSISQVNFIIDDVCVCLTFKTIIRVVMKEIFQLLYTHVTLQELYEQFILLFGCLL
jgi:aspartokinase